MVYQSTTGENSSLNIPTTMPPSENRLTHIPPSAARALPTRPDARPGKRLRAGVSCAREGGLVCFAVR